MFEFILIAGTVLVIVGVVAQILARDKAKAAYQASLSELSKNPTDADARQKTLKLGRIYSNLTRNNKGVSLFDEVALMNDINAACGGTTAIAKSSTLPEHTALAMPSLESRLMQLTKLKEQGLVSDEEYQAKRQQLLNEV